MKTEKAQYPTILVKIPQHYAPIRGDYVDGAWLKNDIVKLEQLKKFLEERRQYIWMPQRVEQKELSETEKMPSWTLHRVTIHLYGELNTLIDHQL